MRQTCMILLTRWGSVVRALFGGLALVLSACNSAEPAVARVAPAARFALIGSDSAPKGATLSPAIGVSERQVEFLGIVSVPSPCHSLSARVMREGSQLVARIQMIEPTAPCAPVPAQFTFHIVQPTNPGQYTARVTLERPGTGSPIQLLAEQAISVSP